MPRKIRLALMVAALLMAATPGTRAADDAAKPHVDVLLVLAADVSRSIDATKFDLQRKGYASALTDPRVLEAIASNQDKRIAVELVEWSGASSQQVVVGWTLISGERDARAFADRVLVAPRAFADRTAIGSGITFAAQQFPGAPFEATRRIIDVSGDGTDNSGVDIVEARDGALANGVTAINGLVILSSDDPADRLFQHTHPPGGLAEYYRRNVIGGEASFVTKAKDFESFNRALITKIIEEIT